MDGWGLIRSRLTPSAKAKNIAKEADLIYVAGTGSLARVFRLAGAARIRYSFSGADSQRFGTPWSPTARHVDVVMIANRNRGRIPGSALPGAWRRGRLVELLRAPIRPAFRFVRSRVERPSKLEGSTTRSMTKAQQTVRLRVQRQSWHHFPGIPNALSNKVPISLVSGVPHVTNYPPGIELIYPPVPGSTGARPYALSPRWSQSCSPCRGAICWSSASKLDSHTSTFTRKPLWYACLRTCQRSGQPMLGARFSLGHVSVTSITRAPWQPSRGRQLFIRRESPFRAFVRHRARRGNDKMERAVSLNLSPSGRRNSILRLASVSHA